MVFVILLLAHGNFFEIVSLSASGSAQNWDLFIKGTQHGMLSYFACEQNYF